MNESDHLRLWVREHPGCVSCGKWGSVQKHHVKTRGSMRGQPRVDQDRENVVPLCVQCHDKVHKMGRKTFEKTFNIDLKIVAMWVWGSAMRGTEYELEEWLEEGGRMDRSKLDEDS